MTTKALMLISMMLISSGCATAPADQEKQDHTGLWIAIGAAVVIGAVALSKDESGQNCRNSVVVRPGGSETVTRCK